jgi:hypothetical protein
MLLLLVMMLLVVMLLLLLLLMVVVIVGRIRIVRIVPNVHLTAASVSHTDDCRTG